MHTYDPPSPLAQASPTDNTQDLLHTLTVSPQEEGQKLLSFLERRLSLPPTLLHRWIRTGQIRVNKGRAKPFQRLTREDIVRLPPFASKMADAARAPLITHSSTTGTLLPLPPRVSCASEPDLSEHIQDYIWAFNKPAGLPTHTGSGHTDSFATRLQSHFAEEIFLPSPAHRLDKDTSGLLLVGASFPALRFLQNTFLEHTAHKEYLTWVEGRWENDSPMLLEHSLSKRYTGYFEKVMPNSEGKEARCIVAPLRQENQTTLLHIRLLTGRTHQIRAQLAACGHPLCGDSKYGAKSNEAFRLHAMRLILPENISFECLPPWEDLWRVTTLPPLL